MLLLAALGCTDPDRPPADEDTPDDDTATSTADTAPDGPTGTAQITFEATLDGQPAGGVTLSQGGREERWTTGDDGRADVIVDYDLDGEIWVTAAHPEARMEAVSLRTLPDGVVSVSLERYDATDNEAYVFMDPGEPDRRSTTGQCAHCHVTINDAWYASPHRTSASGSAVQDLYSGTVEALATEEQCALAGGNWWLGLEPGTGTAAERCYLGDGVLPVLNAPACGISGACDAVATAFGACADCHAPGIDGALGGRDLLEATGHAYEFGVHCDVCHHIDDVDLAAEAGVAGRLRITRPSEPALGGIDEDFRTLLFGPYDDVATGIMGSVQREHFEDERICAGCHELLQPVLVPGVAIDLARWPDGRLPIHTTYSEWLAGPMNPAAPCQSCHMPPDPDVGNSADLGNEFDIGAGIVGGWFRPPGSVRRHAWYGPRQRDSGMVELAAALFVEKQVSDGELTVTVETKNVGPGHAIPTGEPLRSLVLLVEATCDGGLLDPTGGDAVPDFGGALATKVAGEDWTVWPGASVGQVVRVILRPGTWHDDPGYGPFGDGTFDAEAKGMPVEEVAGVRTIIALSGDVATFDAPLPAGDVAYLADGGLLPADGAAATAWAGAPGFAFARVLTAADGTRMVPHFLAVDVASDNRILPQQSVVTAHRFASPCADPVVHVELLHRAFPLALAAERRWMLSESVMAEVWR